MSVQVAAHGFPLTASLRGACVEETAQQFEALAREASTFRWFLSRTGTFFDAHLSWHVGEFHGDVRVTGDDMYAAIRSVARKAHENLLGAKEQRLHQGRRAFAARA